MKSFNKPIRSLHELDREIRHLQGNAARIKTRIGENYQHVKDHLPQLLFATAFRGRGKTGFAVMLLGMVMKNEKMQDFFQNFINQIAEKGIHWVERLFKKKES